MTDFSTYVARTPETEQVFDLGTTLPPPTDAPRIHCISIIGQVEGHYLGENGQKSTRYEHLLPHLVAVEQNPSIEGVLVLVHTAGGDVEAGLAIAELIAGMQKRTASLVLGGGHSIGVPLAVAADRSFIVPSATMTLHPVRTGGPVLGAPQSFAYLAKIQARIENFVLSHARIAPDKLHALMMATDELATDMGTILDGREAVAAGLVDAVGTLADALAWLGKTDAKSPRSARDA